jgi:IS30 family transposase
MRSGDPKVEPGHWEGDLLVGKRNFTVAVVLSERRSRLTLLGACPQGRNSTHVAAVISRLLSSVPPQLRRSLTWDQGSELARWADIEANLDIPVFFAQPRSPWQRPLAENTCGHLRRWLPRNHPIPNNQTTLDRIARTLNSMPRRTLGGTTATNAYDRLTVATTS